MGGGGGGVREMGWGQNVKGKKEEMEGVGGQNVEGRKEEMGGGGRGGRNVVLNS